MILLMLSVLISMLIGCGNKEGTGTDPDNDDTTDLSSLVLTLSSNTVSFGTPVTVSATLRNKDGNLVSGAVVSFAASSALVAFNPVSATALTSAGGVATVTMDAASIHSEGATNITATSTFASGSTTHTLTSAPVGITVNGATLSLGAVALGSPTISAYGTSSVAVPVFVDAAPATVPISVTFTSPCATAGKATISSPVTTIGGTATSTYTDKGCSGTDVITASVTGATSSATITVSAPTTNNIQFTSATPSVIGTSSASAASLPTSSLVKFRVVDSSNNGLSGVVVDFTVVPESRPGGLSLSAASATSDASGYVTVSLSSGTVPTPVWVVATVHGTALTTQSNTLTITTGLPTQNFFSLSVQTSNIEGWNYDGTTSSLMIIASDRLGNPVPDGTAVNFITEGAQITPASCATSGGTCSVDFKSAEQKPADGRVTILAYAIGEKSFLDPNSSNSYDAGETFYDIGDPYIDANENGVWDAGEFSIASTTAGTQACLTRPAGTPLPGSYWNAPSKENTCTAAWGQNYVRRSAVIVLSGSHACLANASGSSCINPYEVTVDMGSFCNRSFELILTDVNGNPMPAATSLAISNSEVYFTNDLLGSGTATTSIDAGSPVGNTNAFGGTSMILTVTGGASCTAPGLGSTSQYPSGYVNIKVLTPNNQATTIPIIVTGDTP